MFCGWCVKADWNIVRLFKIVVANPLSIPLLFQTYCDMICTDLFFILRTLSVQWKVRNVMGKHKGESDHCTTPVPYSRKFLLIISSRLHPGKQSEENIEGWRGSKTAKSLLTLA
jgi:hypothetical protein